MNKVNQIMRFKNLIDNLVSISQLQPQLMGLFGREYNISLLKNYSIKLSDDKENVIINSIKFTGRRFRSIYSVNVNTINYLREPGFVFFEGNDRYNYILHISFITPSNNYRIEFTDYGDGKEGDDKLSSILMTDGKLRVNESVNPFDVSPIESFDVEICYTQNSN